MMTAILALAAVLLDWVFGEPRRWHPLAGFGTMADRVETALRRSTRNTRHAGILAVFLLLVPIAAAAIALAALPYAGAGFSVLALTFALGHRSLHDHARPVADALRDGDEDKARALVAHMVSRDSSALDIPGAATESVLENGNDGVFAALFWFVLAGAPGVIVYRLANTLDAMWGYRNERYRDFGWAAARFDDVANYLPARLTALTYALVEPANFRNALACWRNQAPAWDSPNAGPVMAAGAGALGITIGGPARYRGEWHERPVLGEGPAPKIGDIERALQLVRKGVGLWLAVFLAAGALSNA